MEGGFWMYPILLLGLVAVALAALQLVLGNRVFQLAAVVVALAPAVLGVLGWMHGRSSVDNVLGMVTPEDRPRLQAQGYKEAQRPLQFGGAITGLCVPLLVVGAFRKR